MNKIVCLVLSATATVALGCQAAGEESDARELSRQSLETAEAKLDPPSKEPLPTPDWGSVPAITLQWVEASAGVTRRTPAAPLHLRVSNNFTETLSASIQFEVAGLGAKREQSSREIQVPPNSTMVVEWRASMSPVLPVRTSATLSATAKYSLADQTTVAHGAVLSFALSATGDSLYIASDDDFGVRLASLTGHLRSMSDPIQAAERDMVLAAMGSRYGRVDGEVIGLDAEKVDETRARVVDRLVDDPTENLTDMVATPGTAAADEQIAREQSEVPGESALAAAPAVQLYCGFNPMIPARESKICAKLKPSFSDIGVFSTAIGPEDFNPYGSPASYMNARVYTAGSTTNLWSGRLDADGCTPVLSYCTANLRTEVQVNSIRIPNTFTTTTLVYGTRDIIINPPIFYTASMYFTSSPTAARADIVSSSKQVRVASVVAQMLRTSDNGVLRGSFSSTPPSLTLDLTNGCTDYDDLEYAPGLYGGACAGANKIQYGPEINPSVTPIQLTGAHTTDSAYVIAHELGHAAQRSNSGANNAPGPYATASIGPCSCDHVTTGNNLHCFQSRDTHSISHREGFAHHYATRLFNFKGPDARFTYYKDFRRITWTGGTPAYFENIYPPPYAVNPGPSFIGYPYSTSPRKGWARSFCGSYGGQSTEYDYLRFFWAINASASSSEQSSLANIFAIFGQNPTAQLSFASVATQAGNVHSPSSPRYQRFYNSMFEHGLNQ